MSLDIDTPVFKYFDKDTPNWAKLGKYIVWLFDNHVPGRIGMSGVFALKVSPGVKKPLLSADFWCSPLGQGFCCSITGTDEDDVWVRSVKYAETIRKQAIEHKSKVKKRKK